MSNRILIKGSKKWNYGRPVYVSSEFAGHGSFLDPPGHHTHNAGAVAGINRGNGFQEYSTIEYYMQYADADGKKHLRDLIRLFTKTATDEELYQWRLKVIAYFKNCYSIDGIDRSSSACDIIKGNPFSIGIDRSLAVMHIRHYYPAWNPYEHIDEFKQVYESLGS